MLSIVVPVYCSENSLRELYERLVASLEANNYNFEIIFVDDFSTDKSWEIISEIGGQDDRVIAIHLRRNFGQHNALLCGIREADGQIIVTLDDDLQHPPEDIHQLVKSINEGFDVVYAPPLNEQHSLFRNFASKIVKLTLQSAMGSKNASNVSAFRAFRAELRDAFADYKSPNVNLDVLLTWATSKFTAVKTNHQPRQHGTSTYTNAKLLVHALNMLTGFSTRPLKFASFLGFVFALFGVVILSFVVLQRILLGATVPGFAFLASVISIFSGVQLLALGIIGEYLSRLHLQAMTQPAYLIAVKKRRCNNTKRNKNS